jgi:hypothetical protein
MVGHVCARLHVLSLATRVRRYEHFFFGKEHENYAVTYAKKPKLGVSVLSLARRKSDGAYVLYLRSRQRDVKQVCAHCAGSAAVTCCRLACQVIELRSLGLASKAIRALEVVGAGVCVCVCMCRQPQHLILLPSCVAEGAKAKQLPTTGTEAVRVHCVVSDTCVMRTL